MSDIDEKDLDMDDVAGEVVEYCPPVEEEPVEVKEEEKADPEVDEFRQTIERLVSHTKKNKTWLCIPDKNKEGNVTLREATLQDCSSEFFYEWLVYAWSPAEKMDHKPENYDKVEYREKAFRSVVAIHKLCRKDPKPEPEKKTLKKSKK